MRPPCHFCRVWLCHSILFSQVMLMFDDFGFLTLNSSPSPCCDTTVQQHLKGTRIAVTILHHPVLLTLQSASVWTMPAASTLFSPFHSTPMHPCNIHLTAALYRTPPRTQFAIVQLRVVRPFSSLTMPLSNTPHCVAHSGVSNPFQPFQLSITSNLFRILQHRSHLDTNWEPHNKDIKSKKKKTHIMSAVRQATWTVWKSMCCTMRCSVNVR